MGNSLNVKIGHAPIISVHVRLQVQVYEHAEARQQSRTCESKPRTWSFC